MLDGMRTWQPAPSGPDPPAARLARWLRPLLGIVLVSSSISFAATLALDRAWESTTAPPTPTPEPLGQGWVEIRVIQANEPSQVSVSMRCRARPGVVRDTVVMIAPADFGHTAYELCAPG
jgi:hypothetical protein